MTNAKVKAISCMQIRTLKKKLGCTGCSVVPDIRQHFEVSGNIWNPANEIRQLLNVKICG